jgi:solute carrier family 25 carnitine/acylcarnitine transporter 20/29
VSTILPRYESVIGSVGEEVRADINSAAIAHPTETIKCKLQLQLVKPAHEPKQFSGPIDVVRQTVQMQGITGMWKGVGASFIYRTCFAAMFGGTSSVSYLPPLTPRLVVW